MPGLTFDLTQWLRKSMLQTTLLCNDWEALKCSWVRIVALGILPVRNIKMEVHTINIYVVGIIEKIDSLTELWNSTHSSTIR